MSAESQVLETGAALMQVGDRSRDAGVETANEVRWTDGDRTSLRSGKSALTSMPFTRPRMTQAGRSKRITFAPMSATTSASVFSTIPSDPRRSSSESST